VGIDKLRLKGKVYVRGVARGELLPTLQPVSFLGGVDPQTGKIRDQQHELYGVSLKGKIFAVPRTVGSSVGAYVIYGMSKRGTGPAGVITQTGDINLVSGCAVSNVPLIADIDIRTLLDSRGKSVILNAEKGFVEV
jgi:predicted aconitase with swiveling domain